MPGKKISDHQVHKFKVHRNTLSQVASAAKVGISERSARRIEQGSPLSADEQQQLQTALTKVVKQQKDREGADVRV